MDLIVFGLYVTLVALTDLLRWWRLRRWQRSVERELEQLRYIASGQVPPDDMAC